MAHPRRGRRAAPRQRAHRRPPRLIRRPRGSPGIAPLAADHPAEPQRHLARHRRHARGVEVVEVPRVEAVGTPSPAPAASPRRMGTHGLPSTYSRYGCRCEACTAANTRRVNRARRERRERLSSAEIVHGAAAYTNWGCRCEVCTTANTKRNVPFIQSWVTRVQAETRAQATRSGRRWTTPELDLLSRRDLTAKQVAIMTGRTWRAVALAKSRLARAASPNRNLLIPAEAPPNYQDHFGVAL